MNAYIFFKSIFKLARISLTLSYTVTKEDKVTGRNDTFLCLVSRYQIYMFRNHQEGQGRIKLPMDPDIIINKHYVTIDVTLTFSSFTMSFRDLVCIVIHLLLLLLLEILHV